MERCNQSVDTNTTFLSDAIISNNSNCSMGPIGPMPVDAQTAVNVAIFGLICVVGLVGNGLVIFVILRYSKMKTVTNMYILNLSIADTLFLLGLPMIMTTAILRQWIFGFALCKIYYILTCINMFTGAFTLAVMSGDRFLAVCFPITSMQYRTANYAAMAIAGTWITSILLMIPVVIYAGLFENPIGYSCLIEMPTSGSINPQSAYILYTLVLGFIIPVLLIFIFYSLLLIRLRSTGPSTKSAEKRRSHRKVTKLVTLIIAIYIICWLPYWAFQVHLITRSPKTRLASWQIFMFTFFTILSYVNSMANPCLYAFTNDAFRESFISAFRCAADTHLQTTRRGSESNIANNNSFNLANKSKKLKDANHTQYQFTTLPSDDACSNNLDHSKVTTPTTDGADGIPTAL